MLSMNATARTALGGWVPPDIWLVTITHSNEVPRTELQVAAVNMNINKTYISWVFTIAQPLDFIFLNLFIPFGVSDFTHEAWVSMAFGINRGPGILTTIDIKGQLC